ESNHILYYLCRAMLEKFQRQDDNLMDRIKGCIMDSAPVATVDPQVWASGFSAAILKKNIIAAKGYRNTDDITAKPAMTETTLLMVLEKFFDVILNLPAVNQDDSIIKKMTCDEDTNEGTCNFRCCAYMLSKDVHIWKFTDPCIKDHKYKNRERLNRATVAGYWKATGKDRTIKTSRGSCDW
nr:transmembrane protein 53 [Tanacetum cinerariifolium]